MLKTTELAEKLQVSKTTVKAYAKKLEFSGYKFKKDDKGSRIFAEKEQDIMKKIHYFTAKHKSIEEAIQMALKENVEETKRRSDAWSEEEDQLLARTTISHIKSGSTQLAAFEEVGAKVTRTPASCGFRWNSQLRKQYSEELERAKKERVTSIIKNKMPRETTIVVGKTIKKEEEPVSVKEVQPQQDFVLTLAALAHYQKELDVLLQEENREILTKIISMLKNGKVDTLKKIIEFVETE